MKNKALALAVILCLVLALMAGCGTTGSSASKPNGSTASNPAASGTNETEPSAQPETPETHEVSYPLVDEPITLTVYYQAASQILSNFGDIYSQGPTYLAAAEKTGVSLEGTAVTLDEYANTFNIMVAGGTMCDLISDVATAYAPGIDAAVDNGLIVDLSTKKDLIPNYYALLESDESVFKDAHTDSGVLGAFYRIFDGPQRIRSGMMIRQDWLDKLDMDTPVTYDDLHETLTAFKNEFGGSMMLLSDLSCSFSDGYDVQMYQYENFNALYQVDGDVRFGPVQPEAREYLKMLNQWYSEGLIYADNITVSSRFYIPFIDAASPTLEGKIGYMNSLCELIPDWNRMASDEGMSFVGLPSPVKNEGDTLKIGSSLVVTSSRLATDAAMAVNADCEYADIAMQYMDFWFTEEGTQMAKYGIEGESYTMVDGKPQFTDLVINNEEFAVDMARKIYCAKDMPHLNAVDIVDSTYPEVVLETYELWSSNRTNEYCMPSYMSLTADESDTASSTFAEIKTFVAENMLSFVVGDKSLDSDWDSYCSTIESMGLETVLDIYQAAYDRYIER